MDIQSAFLSLGVCIGCAAVVYVISIFGTQEKSYEQAIEEQRKRNQSDNLQKSSSDKLKKEKKFKKWGRRSKEKSDQLDERELDQKEFQMKTSFTTTEQSIIDNTEDLEIELKSIKPKKKNRPPVSKLNVSQRENGRSLLKNTVGINHGSENYNEPYQETALEVEPVFRQEREMSVLSLQCENEQMQHTLPVSFRQSDLMKQLSETGSAGQSLATISTPAKKKKRDNVDKELVNITGDRLVSMLKKTDLCDEEIQSLIEVLLNKQKGATEWTKKKDPVALLKKQLQEKEQALEMEQKHTQSISAKIRELRQELTQEKILTSSLKGSIKEMLAQKQQELQSLENCIKVTQEQHLVEKSTFQSTIQQIQNVNDEHVKAINLLQEEKNQLQQILANRELENKTQAELNASRLQQELEQLCSERDQYKARQVALQQNKDQLHDQIVQLEETNSFNQKQGHDDKILIEELKTDLMNSRSTCKMLEAENLALKENVKEAEEHLEQTKESEQSLKKNLEESSMNSSMLECEVAELKHQMFDLGKQYSDQTIQLKNIKEENDKLAAQLSTSVQRIAGDGQEALNQNGEFIDKAQKTVGLADHERILQEKDERANQLQCEINKQKSEILSLREEIENQKQKNNELREKNWKAMEAVSSSEKVAELTIQQIKNDAEEKIKVLLNKEKEGYADQERLNQKLVDAEASLLKLKKDYEDKINHIKKEAHENENHTKVSMEKKFEEIIETSDQKVKEVQKLALGLKNEIESVQNDTRVCLQRIFPNIDIFSSLSYSAWLNQFEEKAMTELETTTFKYEQRKDELSSKLADAEKQKEVLDAQIKHYQTVLSKTESILNKLQSSVESEEQVWKKRLQAKDQELQNMLKEKESLESSLEQLHGLEEMKVKLQELQSKLKCEEAEKKQLQQTLDEACKNALNLRGQIESKEIQIEQLLKEKIFADAAKKELEDVKLQLEKEKKIIKDLSSQTVKLHSLVKIGQDALKAEQETVKQLKLELAKVATESGSAPAIASIQEKDEL